MIAWDDTMTTGIPYIDRQHQTLIEKFNVLLEAVHNGAGREETGEILDFLQFYASWHFEREERCMTEYACPVAKANQNSHATFLTKFQRLYDAYHDSDVDPNIIYDTLDELAAWIVNHIQKIDTELNHCVTGDEAAAI